MNEPNVSRIGGRIARLRRGKQLSQAQLAQTLNISPSYLNLIERNRRRITIPLLLKVAQFFGVEVSELADNDDTQLVGDLMEVFGDEMFGDLGLTNLDVREVAVSHSKVGQAVIRLFDHYLAMRNKHGYEDLTLGQAENDTGADALSDFIQENSNHFPDLEEAADRVRHDIELTAETPEYGLATYLYNVFGLRWRRAPLQAETKVLVDMDRGEIVTSDILPAESSLFIAAKQLGSLSAEAEITEILSPWPLPEGAYDLARNALGAYFAAALLMPYDRFHKACLETRFDIERLAVRFRASFEQVCHRMTSLQRPGSLGIPFHFVRTDIAGNISKRFSLSGIRIPRHVGACPRWNVYSAFLHPGQINVQVSQMPDGQRYLCVARSISKGGYGHNAPRQYLSVGIGCQMSHARSWIYSDGIDMNNREQAVPIGGGCRFCPRTDCGQRVHPPAHSYLLEKIAGQP